MRRDNDDGALRAVQRFYETHPRMISSPFGGVDAFNDALFEDALAALGISLDGRRVLDVGCGRGFPGAVVRARGGQYAGADLLPSGQGFPLAQADAAALPFASASFDLVLCIDASEHFTAPALAAAEFRRVLRPGGSLFLSAPNYGNVAGLVKAWCERFGGYARDTWAPFGQWTPQEREQPLTQTRVRQLYRNAGFQEIRRVPLAAEAGLGVFPWLAHPRMPEALYYRLQRLFNAVGPPLVRVWPGASLHLFWRIDA